MDNFVERVTQLLIETSATTLSGVFNAIAGFAPSLIILCLTIYSFMLGIGYISGNAKPINRILFDLFLVILVGAAAMNYKFLAEPTYQLLVGLIQDTEGKLSGNRSLSEMIWLILKTVYDYVDIAAGNIPIVKNFAWLGLTILITVPAVILMAMNYAFYLIVFFAGAVVIGLFPLLVVFAAFSPTRELFWGAVRQLINYLLLGLLSIVAVGFTYRIILVANTYLVQESGSEPESLLAFALAIYMMLIVTSQLPQIATGIAGGVMLHAGNGVNSAKLWAANKASGLSRAISNRAMTRRSGTSRITRGRDGMLRGAGMDNRVGRTLTKLSTSRNP